jgi:hypothetical protein
MSEEYLDMPRLLERVPLSETTIVQAIREGVLIQGVHYSRPTTKAGSRKGGKRIFFWSAIEKWMKGQDFGIRRDQIQRSNSWARAER